MPQYEQNTDISDIPLRFQGLFVRKSWIDYKTLLTRDYQQLHFLILKIGPKTS